MNLKKYVGIGIFSLLLLTGCGNTKKLECNVQQHYSDDMKTNQKVIATFDGDELAKLSIDMNVELEGQYIEYIDDLIDGSTSGFEQYKDKTGFKYSTSKKDNGFKFELDINFKKADEEVKTSFSFINAYNNYEQIKNELESNGYTCK